MVRQVLCIKLVVIPSISEVRGRRKVCFGAFLRHTKGFRAAKKSLPPLTYLREPIVSKALERKLREWTIVNTLEALDSKFILTKALTKL